MASPLIQATFIRASAPAPAPATTDRVGGVENTKQDVKKTSLPLLLLTPS